MAQPPVAADDDKYFDLLCHAAKRGRLEQLKTLLSQYSVRTHYSKRDESGAVSTRAFSVRHSNQSICCRSGAHSLRFYGGARGLYQVAAS